MLSEFQPNWLNNSSKFVEFPKKRIVPQVRCCLDGGVGNSGAWPDIQHVCSGRKYNGNLCRICARSQFGIAERKTYGRLLNPAQWYLPRVEEGVRFGIQSLWLQSWDLEDIFLCFFYTPRINFIIQLLYVHPAKQLLGFSLVTAWLPVCLPQFSTQRFPYRMDGGVTSSSNWSFKE